MTAPALAESVSALHRRALTWWSTLTGRERRMATLASAAIAAVLLWALALQPALRTLRDAPPTLEKLDAESQQMHLLAAESRTLRSAPPVPPAQAAAALKAASTRLGDKASLVLQGERATVTLRGIDGATLRSFLTEVRGNARARPVEAQLVRGAKGYDGTLVFAVGGTP
jgi:general secretion pathway protein M